MRVFLIVLIFALFLNSPAIAQEKTGWSEDGLKGRVRNIRTDVADISLVFGKYVEKERRLWSITTYDIKGNKIEELSSTKTVFRYNSQGKLIEKVTYTSQGSVYAKWVFTYSDDGIKKEEMEYDGENNLYQKDVLIYEKGKLIKTLTYDGIGNLKSTSLIKYDSMGRQVSVSQFYSDDTLQESVVNTYDDLGNIDWVASYFSEGLQDTWKWSYNKNGDMIREDRFNANGSPHSTEVYVYKYDSHRNWIWQARSEWFPDEVKLNLKPKAVFYRVVSYY